MTGSRKWNEVKVFNYFSSGNNRNGGKRVGNVRHISFRPPDDLSVGRLRETLLGGESPNNNILFL